MKVKDLIKILKKADQEREVILSIDEEGNGFNYLNEVITGAYSEDGNYTEFGLEKLTPKLKAEGFTEEDVVKGKPVICLWP